MMHLIKRENWGKHDGAGERDKNKHHNIAQELNSWFYVLDEEDMKKTFQMWPSSPVDRPLLMKPKYFLSSSVVV